MKVLLVAINSKYIHPNLAVRLLKANTEYPTEIKEFTIKDDVQNIVRFINDGNYDVVGFSCYIWNIEIIRKLLPQVNAKYKVLGGPEVSYDAERYIEGGIADFVIKNEGEVAFNELLKYLDHKAELCDVPNLYFKGGFTHDATVDVGKLKQAYYLYDEPMHKLSYIETSRGCPYRCGYCMASLDKKLRFFDINKVISEIEKLRKRGAKTFKFLDRTFNAGQRFQEVIDYIIKNHSEGESYQFEITGDILSEAYIDYINEKAPKNLIRFEIGIQSTNIESNKAVGRIQNNERLFSNIRKLQDGGKIDLHLDLICGLPLEDFESFRNTFNDCISLRPKELQLGFLKLLKGTPIYNEIEKHGYIFSEMPPYEIISNNYITREELDEIHFLENAFDNYYNKGIYKAAMQVLLDNEPDVFSFFQSLGKDLEKGSIEKQYKFLDDFVKEYQYYDTFHEALILDYLNFSKVKPKAWWKENVPENERKIIFREIAEKDYDININDLYRHGLLIELPDKYIVGIWTDKYKMLKIFGKT